MSYNYGTEKPKLFTENGVKMLRQIEKAADILLEKAGAFRQIEVTQNVSGDSFTMLACLDYLVEQNKIVRLRSDCWGQYQVYSTPQVHNAQGSVMGYIICKLQNVSGWGKATPDIVITEDDKEWESALTNWKDMKNPTDSPLWKKGVFALTRLILSAK